MINSAFIFIVAIQVNSFNDEIINDYLNIQRAQEPIFIKKTAESQIIKINDYLNKYNEKAHNKFFLIKFKNDLEKITKMSEAELKNFEERFTDFMQFVAYEMSSNYNQTQLQRLFELEKLTWEPFGNFSYMFFLTSQFSLGACVENYKSKDWEDIILSREDLFNHTEWKNNYELGFFHSLLCANYENTKNFRKMEQLARLAVKMDNKNLPKNDIYKLGPKSFLIKSLARQSKNKEALELILDIPKNQIECKERHASKVLLRIFSSAYYINTNIGNKSQANFFMNLSLEKIDQIIGTSNKEAEAKKLDEIMVQYGDLVFSQEIKKRYNLKISPNPSP